MTHPAQPSTMGLHHGMTDQPMMTAQALQENLGNSLRNLRIEHDVSQSTLAEQLGVAISTVSRWERGVKMPTPAKMAELMNYYGVDTIELGAVWEVYSR